MLLKLTEYIGYVLMYLPKSTETVIVTALILGQLCYKSDKMYSSIYNYKSNELRKFLLPGSLKRDSLKVESFKIQRPECFLPRDKGSEFTIRPSEAPLTSSPAVHPQRICKLIPCQGCCRKRRYCVALDVETS